MIEVQEHAFARHIVSPILGIDAIYRQLLHPDLQGLTRDGVVTTACIRCSLLRPGT
jgi:hypothetical protein